MKTQTKNKLLLYCKIIHVLLVMVLLSSPVLQAQDFYSETYKTIADGLNPKLHLSQFKVGYVTLASIGLPSSRELDQLGFYGFGTLQLEKSTNNSLVGKIRIYTSRYEYKNVLDLTPTQDLFPLNQAVYEYNLQLFPSGKVSYQLLINGKLFLNRPPTVVQAYSFQKGYIQAGPLVMYVKVGSGLPEATKPEIEIAYSPVVSFENLRRDNSSGGQNVLAVGENRIATVYRIDKITNNSNKDYTLYFKNLRTVADQSSSAYFGSGSSHTILSLVKSEIPNYFVGASASIMVPRQKSIELSSSRIVLVYSSTQKDKPANLTHNQQVVRCIPTSYSFFELIPIMDIKRLNNFQ